MLSPTRLSRANRRLLGVLALSLAVVLAWSPVAADARTVHTVVQDDALSLFAPQSLARSMATLRWLGVDYLRVSAEWKLEAPDPNSTESPAGFDPMDPAAYTSPGMLVLDRAVRAAAAAGLQVMVDPAFSAPLWATTDHPAATTTGDPWYRTNIDVGQLAEWEAMLARRYSGTFTPAGTTTPLPRVAAFTLWNEPNDAAFLQPQWRDGVAVSADWYRRLVDIAYPAIKAVDPGATVLIGNTSDAGGDPELGSGGVPPLNFIRRLACVNDQLQPITDGACAHYQPLPADGYAHHPYERSAPPWAPSGAGQTGWAQMGDLSQLQSLLDTLVAMHRLAPGAANLWLTEQGYESNAQLTNRPWTEAQQAQLDADSEYQAWRDPQLASFSQFLLRDTLTDQTLALRHQIDDPTVQLKGTWTTGLEREDGVAKPALAMFRSPVVAQQLSSAHPACLLRHAPRSGSVADVGLIDVWGRARPVTTPTAIRVEVRDAGASAFTVARTATSDENGVFEVQVTAPQGAAVRFQWRTVQGWQSSPAVAPSAMTLPPTQPVVVQTPPPAQPVLAVAPPARASRARPVRATHRNHRPHPRRRRHRRHKGRHRAHARLRT